MVVGWLLLESINAALSLLSHPHTNPLDSTRSLLSRWRFWSKAAFIFHRSKLEQPPETESRVHSPPGVGGGHQLFWQYVFSLADPGVQKHTNTFDCQKLVNAYLGPGAKRKPTLNCAVVEESVEESFDPEADTVG